MADVVREMSRGVDHSGSHKAGVISLDLEVDVVRMGIVFPETGLWGHDAIADVVPGCLVGVPEGITGGGKSFGKALNRSVKSLFLKNFHKSKIHVDVVVQPRSLVIIPFDPMFRPLDLDVVIDQRTVNKLRRTAVGASDHLACPATFNLVHQLFLGDRDFRRKACRFRGLITAGTGEQSQHRNGND